MDRGRGSRGFRRGPSRGQSSHRGRSEGTRGGFGKSPSEGQKAHRGRSEGVRGGFRGHHPRSHSQSGASGGREAQVNSTSDKDKNDRRYIGYQKLVSWADETDPDKLVVSMVFDTDALIDLLKKMEIKPDWYSLLFKICRLILSVNHQKQALKKILTVFADSHFFGHSLYNFVEKKKVSRWHDAKEFYEEVVAIFKEILNLIPQCAGKCQMPLTLLRDMVQNTKEVCEEKDLLLTISDLQGEVAKIQSENRGEPKFRKKFLRYNDADTPPEDFRELSVVPQKSDLSLEAEPFLRAILSKGSYRDEVHYLDVVFRLMREDFIHPLREGINEFKMAGCRKNHKSSDIRLYFGVRIIGMTTVNGINHVLEFDMKSLKSVNWEHSKRFLSGSLLCLSNDNFETLYFATAAFRNPKDLKDGIITVEFMNELEDIFCISSSEIFVMAETTAYFEAYSPVLEGLKEMDFTFTHQKYFIYCQETLKPPEYLLGGVREYNLASLTKSGQRTRVPVLNTMSWPQVDKMNLNESQREAAQLALTKELAIIQGPPGTGKTYVGLKLMKVLLENRDKMAGIEENNTDPILVVCFTNHALDQFLEGVLEFCPKGIVRVGGRSSSELLESMNLKNLKKNEQIALTVRRALRGARDELRHISNKIKAMKSKIDLLYIFVQTEKCLEQFMLPNHYTSLQAQFFGGFFRGKDFSTIKNWLNAPTSLSKDTLSQLIKNHMTALVLKMQNIVFIDENLKPNKLKESLMKMPVIERAGVYQHWLQVYLSMLKHTPVHYFRILEESKTRILSDSDISAVISGQIFNVIYSLSYTTGSSIENWIIGSNNDLNRQLDDIESLMQFYSQNGEKDCEVTDDVEEVVRSQNSRLIDIDLMEEEKIAAETKEIKDGDIFLQIRAEKLGINLKDNSHEEKDEYGWQTVTHRKTLSFSMFTNYLATIEPLTEEEEQSVDDLWILEIQKRFALYNLWIQRYRSEMAKEMECLVHEYKEAMKGKKELSMTSDIDILKKAKVIGMTTTGAAKNRVILQAVGCRIIVVEEAAEVLEAHIITSLNKNCKHLILIGDHQQLKPNPTVYTLAKDYHLDLSLFERLINNGIRHVTLKEQHRMRGCISKIMRHIYPHLQDHISVTKYDDVRGMQKNIFFINHQKHESDVSDSKSKSNAHEALYLVALLNYILLQGYKPNQITVLATYVGQILMLKKELKAKMIEKGVRVTTVDNFQGEENDIILLSLVRSNAHSSVGFLKVDNRVCVALSRAKKGLFAIGNFKLLASQSELWGKIVKTAEHDCIYGEGLPLTCPNHASFKVEISSPEDFQKKCPEGGCGLQCEFRLQCGHACPLKCHGYDSEHEKVSCVKKCARSCPQGHPCNKKCIQKCGNCMEIVSKTIPRCGHTDKIPCYIPAQDAVCSQPCSKLLDCQHHCTGKCGNCDKDKKHRKCETQVEYFWPCDHICKVPCHMKPTEYSCPHKCQTILDCGHKCEGTCFECVNGTYHAACKKQCTRFLPCGHQCPSLCGIPCPPCPKECKFSCRHSKCTSGHCGDVCIPCQEPCRNKCKHAQCTKKCYEECDIEPCNKRCPKILKKCQHRCDGLCGELCVCVQCDYVSVLPQNNLICDDSKDNVAVVQNNELHAKQFEAIAENSEISENMGEQSEAMPQNNELDKPKIKDYIVGNSEISEPSISCAVSIMPQITEEVNMDEHSEAMPQNNEGDKSKKKEDIAGNKKISNPFLIIMIPSCRHIFNVNELDKYVNSLLIDSNHCYLPCPICKKDIQNFFRYNKIIKRKKAKREQEKENIRKVNEVTPKQRIGTSTCQKMLNKIDLNGTWHGLIKCNVFDISTSHEVLSLNCKYKYAHVLSDLLLLDNRSKFQTELESSSKAVLRLGKSLTQQQKSDFRIGLTYLLLQMYVSKFEEMSHGNSVETHLIKKAKKVLMERKLSQHVLDRFFSIVQPLESNLKRVSLTVAKKTVARDLQILDSEDDQMLSDILRS